MVSEMLGVVDRLADDLTRQIVTEAIVICTLASEKSTPPAVYFDRRQIGLSEGRFPIVYLFGLRTTM